ncbi:MULTISPECIES: thiolase family protein [Ensifer]|uniref:Acetyl-CoA C-acyltransferase n=1 Tax=Ensifer canadensis TaxID=555315 RepID=A0AAW4FII7_9HYPH|nr:MULTISPECIES: thiolase family protein [Ensifer]MDP9628174.1 acetyl-CoA C-acetyltransferase [Ensifer adhaerens]KQU72381.1 acetyl-CoA acetyltransferase [Ensifer sp. Root31]KQW44568.1 acetyl-CoA acetyltransferase [Ensifer sp. Root1252]KQW85431.1 acetyl-CoA acetyltransferase [Ensifer sp. Root127]KQY71856.1 acetyl-CoA acetyltransferase [Ensifer sp. Root142]
MSPSSDPSRTPVIVAALRTPVGRVRGVLAEVEPARLAAPLITRILADVGLAAEALDDVILGNAANCAGNLGRLAALEAGLPVSTPGLTIDRQCGAGLEAITLAARLIQSGAGRFYLAGGTESASRAHIRLRPPTTPGEEPQPIKRSRMAPDEIGDPDMGVAAENVATACSISRERQDAFALESQRRAVAAQGAGRFTREIVPIETTAGIVEADECPRANASLETLQRLKPVFVQDGTVTAGNACPINDGAAMVLVTSLAEARRLGLSFALEFIDATTAGVHPDLLGLGPVPAMEKLKARNPALDVDAIDFIEFNEAFASQVLGSLDQLDISPERVNLDGGAIALGHPYGASGAILVVRLFTQMLAVPRETQALAMMGIGGGMGGVALFRSLRPTE